MKACLNRALVVFLAGGLVVQAEESSAPARKLQFEELSPPAGRKPQFRVAVNAKLQRVILPAEARRDAERAKELFEKADYEGAERIYVDLDRKHPRNLYILSNLAGTLMRQVKIDKAQEVIQRALEIAPNDDYVLTLRGIVEFRRDDLAASRKSFEAAVASNQENEVAHQYLGVIESLEGMDQKATAQFQFAHKLDPQLPEPNAVQMRGPKARSWWIGDYLTPLEQSRLQIPVKEPKL